MSTLQAQSHPHPHALIVGGGLGGLAAALGLGRKHISVELFERAPMFSEVGAGIQLGPNVTQILQHWGLSAELAQVASFPARLQVRNAMTGAHLGTMRLGEQMLARYGAPYITIHRADAHHMLLQAAKRQGVPLHLGSAAIGLTQTPDGVTLMLEAEEKAQGSLLVGADGLWSVVRQHLLNDAPPQPTGHLAYRAIMPQSELPQALRLQHITVWLGPLLHVVQYPVRAGQLLNVVAIVHGQVVGDPQCWDHSANAAELRRHLQDCCADLQDLVHAIDHWRLWGLSIRPPMQGPHEQVQGRVALLGDAAHPMVPYLAQGAGMAIEDACTLAQLLSDQADRGNNMDVPAALQTYAQARWQRNAQVQARALRNGQIFHASGVTQLGRDLAMRVMGERLLDQPWLYGGFNLLQNL